MSDGWVLLTDKKYMPLAVNFVESLLEFSKKDIFIVGLDCDFELRDSRITTDRMSFTGMPWDAWYKKIKISLMTPFDTTALVEADMIANRECDELFDVVKSLDLPHTVHPIHGRDHLNQGELMRFLGVEKATMPYCHATYVYTKRALDFLHDVDDACHRVCDSGIQTTSFDESVLNCMLWKHGANTLLNVYDPGTQMVPWYVGKEEVNPLQGYYDNRYVTYHIFHGSKNIEEMKRDYEYIRNFNGERPKLKVTEWL